jgi:hypothetical protein
MKAENIEFAVKAKPPRSKKVYSAIVPVIGLASSQMPLAYSLFAEESGDSISGSGAADGLYAPGSNSGRPSLFRT